MSLPVALTDWRPHDTVQQSIILGVQSFGSVSAGRLFQQLIGLHANSILPQRSSESAIVDNKSILCDSSGVFFPSASTFRQCLDIVATHLRQYASASRAEINFVVCALKLGYGDRSYESWTEGLHDNLITKAMLGLLSTEWNLSSSSVFELITAIGPGAEAKLVLPSAAGSRPGQTSSQTYIWQQDAPRYRNDWDIYTWQPHTSAPQSSTAKLLTINVDPDGTKSILVFEKASDLTTFYQTRNLLRINRQLVLSPGVMATIVLNRMILNATVTVLTNCRKEVQQMKYVGRRDPTASKFRFLAHLEDHRLIAARAVENTKSGLEELGIAIDAELTHVNSTTVDTRPCKQYVEDLGIDAAFLEQELEKAGRELASVQEMIIDHLHLVSSRRNYILTLVAAIYIPLTFVTSLFGMNMSPPKAFTLDSSVDASLGTNSSLLSLPPAALLAAINDSGTLTWSWSTFAAFSCTLLLTVPLALTKGAFVPILLRFFVRTRHRAPWKPIIFVTLPIVFVLTYIVLPNYGGQLGYYTSIATNVVLFVVMLIYAALLHKGRVSSEKYGFSFWFVALCIFVAHWVGWWLLPLDYRIFWPVLLPGWIFALWPFIETDIMRVRRMLGSRFEFWME